MRLLALLSSLCLILTACTTVTAPAPTATPSWESREARLSHLQHWQVAGKIAVQTAKESGSAIVNWIQNRDQYAISLHGPLGTGSLTLTGRPGNVTLASREGQRLTAATAEQLLAQQWGWHLPVSHLTYWIRGLPVPSLPAQRQWDAQHRLSILKQQGWEIQYLNYTNVSNLDLPQKIAIHSSSLQSKMVIHEWKVL